jgi:hypothetical protein
MEGEGFMYFPRFVTEGIYFTSEGRADLGSGLFMISRCLYDDSSTPDIKQDKADSLIEMESNRTEGMRVMYQKEMQ